METGERVMIEFYVISGQAQFVTAVWFCREPISMETGERVMIEFNVISGQPKLKDKRIAQPSLS